SSPTDIYALSLHDALPICGYAFPDAQGVIEVAEGGFVLFSLTGMSSLTNGNGVHVMTFETVYTAHGWLNDVIAIGEGSIDPDREIGRAPSELQSLAYLVCR